MIWSTFNPPIFLNIPSFIGFLAGTIALTSYFSAGLSSFDSLLLLKLGKILGGFLF